MPRSAGILLFRRSGASFQVFLAHPGGPFWEGRDIGAWTIPKGLVEDGEDELEAAVREFGEETSFALSGDFIPLGEVKQKSGKTVVAWGLEGDANASAAQSNTIRTVWPKGSGDWITVPEVDRCEWFDPETAIVKINPAQAEFIRRLADLLVSKL